LSRTISLDCPEDEAALAIGILLLSGMMEAAAPFGRLRYGGEPRRGEKQPQSWEEEEES
jgi:hypothetical protein